MTTATDWSRRLYDDMPMLQDVVRREVDRQPLRGWMVLLIQHQMQDELAQVEALFRLGLVPSDLHWIDIPYTSHPVIRREVGNMGVPHDNMWEHDMPPFAPYEGYQVRRVRRWITDQWLSRYRDRKLLVLDDGGYFLRAYCSELWSPPVAVVEQTVRGMNVARGTGNCFDQLGSVTLVNVAEAPAKKRLESPAIARAVLEALEIDFSEIGADPWRENWLVVGWGNIGSDVGRALAERVGIHRLAVWDVDVQKLALAQSDGFSISPPGDFRRFGVVVGATGENTNLTGRYDDQVILASVSSASVEFSRGELLSAESAYRLLERSGLDGIHSHLRFAGPHGTHLTLLNGGFPVNFDRDVFDRMLPHEIQFTAALMIYGAVQATRSRLTGVFDVDQSISDYLLANQKVAQARTNPTAGRT